MSGSGPTVVRDFLAAGLVDHVHLVQVPIVLGRGVRIWDGLEALEDAYDDDIQAIFDYSNTVGIGGNPDENGRFTDCFTDTNDDASDDCTDGS